MSGPLSLCSTGVDKREQSLVMEMHAWAPPLDTHQLGCTSAGQGVPIIPLHDAQVPQRANASLTYVDVLVSGVNLLLGPTDAKLLTGYQAGIRLGPGVIGGASSRIWV